MALMVIALIDVRWGKVWREVPQKGIEVMFVLDVSRSMLADDAAPSRLERAKQQIKDTIDEMAGDRVGLVVFAGDAEAADSRSRRITTTSSSRSTKWARKTCAAAARGWATRSKRHRTRSSPNRTPTRRW